MSDRVFSDEVIAKAFEPPTPKTVFVVVPTLCCRCNEVETLTIIHGQKVQPRQMCDRCVKMVRFTRQMPAPPGQRETLQATALRDGRGSGCFERAVPF